MDFYLLLKILSKILVNTYVLVKSIRGKYSQKFLDHTKQSTTGAFKTGSEIAIQKTAEATSDLICNKVAVKIKRNSAQNIREIVSSKTKDIGFDAKIPKERYISPEKRQQIIDKLRLILHI